MSDQHNQEGQLTLNVQTEKNSVTVDLIGRATTQEVNLFQSRMDELAESPQKIVLINCKDLEFISSSGLRVILRFAKKISSGRKKLGIYSLNPSLFKIFEISGFNKIINIYENREEAYTSLRR